MAYTNYAQGIFNGTAGQASASYNLLISGGSDYAQHSGIYLGGNTSNGNSGLHVYQNASKDAYIDLLANATNQLGFRYTSNGSTFNNMMTLMNDNMSNSSINAATVNGRVAASQFFVNGTLGDVRAPTAQGLYVATSAAGAANFNVNPGANGTAGFAFTSYNANGSNPVSNLVLNANGSVLMSYYNVTSVPADIMEGNQAIATFDLSGNLVRNYGINSRIRTVESTLATINTDLTAGLTTAVNGIITRLNNLNFYSNNLALYGVAYPPTGVSATATAGTGNATISFTASNSTGASAPVNYVVTASDGTHVAIGVSSPIIITGLIANKAYSFTVQSNCVYGLSVSTASNSVTV